ncbi:MAG: 2-dehydropantoate 2-reductase [Candidatus Thermoplasmatota archaeon]|nr:2-dehydropantoate 2-reductase [Candidatus Thermoplasmatota archaeon]
MRIAILGVGSIGGVLLGALSDTNTELVAVARGRSSRVLSQIGLVLHMPEGSIEAIPPERFNTFDSESGPLPEGIRHSCDVAFICGKADSTPILAQIAEDILTQDGLAISLQNGMGHAQSIAHRLGSERTLGGITTHGAWRDDTGTHWVGRGGIAVGSIDGSAAPANAVRLLEVMQQAGLSPEWSDDIDSSIWTKLLVNVAINPVCSIAGVRNGALLEVPELWNQAISAMSEAAAVARANGVELSELNLEETLREVATKTADNRCSMLQDIMAGKKTEVDQLCGAVVEMGESVGVPTPRNEMLHALVSGIEISPNFD